VKSPLETSKITIINYVVTGKNVGTKTRKALISTTNSGITTTDSEFRNR